MTESLLDERTTTSTELQIWRNALFIIFALPGFAAASWVSRTANIRDVLGASTSQMGLIIFGLAIGSLIGLTAAGHLIAGRGARSAIVLCAWLEAAGFLLVSIGTWIPAGAVVFGGLILFGCGFGMLDVSMNVEGAAAEQAIKKTLMPVLHASYSGGNVIGAIVGSAAVAAGLPVTVHLGITAVLYGAALLLICRFLPQGTGKEHAGLKDKPPLTTLQRMAVWKEPRVLLIGLIVLGTAFAEGSANDWIPIAMVDGYKVNSATGSLVYGIFVAAMTAARFFGGYFLDRFGRVAVLRGCSLLAVIGLVCFIFGSTLAGAVTGVVFWGLGASIGFPVGLSAASDDPRGAAVRVSAVATIGYLAFLVGPPVLGFVGERAGLLKALLIVLAGVIIGGLLSQYAKPADAAGQGAIDRDAAGQNQTGAEHDAIGREIVEQDAAK